MQKVILRINEFSGESLHNLVMYLKRIEPERTEKFRVDQDRNQRKLILKFLGVFHPDKQRPDSEGFKRYGSDYNKMCEEATKCLNKHLEMH